MTTTTIRRSVTLREGGTEALHAAVLVLVTVRAQLLAFSIPYLWLWSEGLEGIVRVALVVAHACTLLAIGTASTAVDCNRGTMPRLGLYRGSRLCRLDLAPTLAQVLTLMAVSAIAALATAPVAWPVPASMALLLAGGWVWARLPLGIKYLAVPDWGGPLLALVLPAATLALTTAASPPPSTIFAGVAFLVAIVFATHLRDRGDDLAADIPTAATRRPVETRNWMWLTAGAGGLTVLTGMYTPLSPAEWVGLLGVLGFAAATTLRERRVLVLTAAHALVGLYWLFG